MMRRPYRILLATLLCAAPLGAFLPGCGGGGGSKAPELSIFDLYGVALAGINGEVTAPPTTANLKLSFEDSPNALKRASGTLQVLTSIQARQNLTSDIAIFPTAGTYICTGTIDFSGTTRVLNLRGSYPGGPAFTITGNFVKGGNIELRAPFKSGISVLVGTFIDPFGGKATATPIITGTPTNTGTPAATTVATPVATPVATTIATPISTATPFSTATPVPTTIVIP